MQFENLMTHTLLKIDDYILLLAQIKEKPELILTDIYSKGSENFLTRIIESSEDISGELIEIHDFQDYIYGLIIPFLQSHFKGKEFLYDTNNYPALLQVSEGDREVGRINIFEKKFIIVPHEDIKREEMKLQSLKENLEQLNQEISKNENYQKDIISYGDTAMQKAKILMRQNHYKQELKTKYQQLIEGSMELEQNIISQQLYLQRVQEDLRPFEDMQYVIADFFRNNYGYEIEREEV